MSTTRTFLAPATIVLTLASIAGAQNALDPGQRNRPDRPDPRASPIKQQSFNARGRALDANQQVGSGGFNAPVANFQAELALRNAVVTGNVGGGKAFRGDVGYSAADDFRAETGSDDLFVFQRESAYSGLATQNLRGIASLQFQLNESTAGQTQGMLGDLIISRSSATTTAAEATGTAPTMTVDPFGNLRGSLRSTSEYLLRESRRPKFLLTTGKAEEGASRLYVIANPLIGTKAVTLGNSIFSIQERPDLMDEGRILGRPRTPEDEVDREGVAKPVGERIEPITPLDSVREDLRVKSNNLRARRFGEKDPEAEKAGRGQEPEAAQEPVESSNERFERSLEEVRDALRQRLKSMETPPPSESPDSDESKDAEGEPEGEEKKSPVEEKTLTTEEIIKRARETLDNGEVRLQAFLDKNGADDLYSWHMNKGEEALKIQRWFEAEERFTAALRAKPGDAMAAAARVNAQIGGSLFLSAGVNLRNLFSGYPELIPARYPNDLFAQGKRLDAIRFALRERLKNDTSFAREAAIILAYVGWQSGNRQDIEDGFGALDRFHEAAKEEAPPLELILKEVWLKE